MATKDDYKEMFVAEALENYEELNKLFTVLEKNHADKKAINQIFRITHTLKGNAMGMGFEAIADLAHVMEDVFSEVKEGKISLDEDLFNNLFKANDKLGLLIDAINSEEKVNYKGIRTKLSVFLKNARDEREEDNEEKVESVETETESEPQNESEELVETGEAEVKEVETEVSETQEEIEEDAVQDINLEEAEQIEDEDQPKIVFSDLVQVPVRKLDSLMNLVGELIIERDSLISKNAEHGFNSNMLARLQRITSDLQYGVMDVRLIQIGFLFNKFHRIIRDVANIEGKKVDLNLEGTEIEIDRNILKIMSDSLIHLVRNSVSHGIEKPADRKKLKKKERGQVTLRARNEKDTVIIDIIDDGAGIDYSTIGKKAVKMGIVSQEYINQASEDEIIMLIFEPGFSNADKITEVSGRGVGMDVVKKATESIGGNIKVKTEVGKGSTISLSLPSSMAVKGALLFELNNQEYAVALSYTEAVVSLTKKDIHKVSNGLMASYLGKTISIIFLNDLYNINNLSELSDEVNLHATFDQVTDDQKLDVLVASYGNKYVGFVVDKLLQQKEIVEKTLEPPLHDIDLVSGATILGNGNVCLVLDIANIIGTLFNDKN
ncbi:chemotaxis protein CheA [Paracrocinitomix mangrovi]|uniref:chemotaxis protein CheA n=1 Tax=Paracrocinitomix mangrovi TaxID=2862509 RepID=UPI001C8DBCDE|nr:chemotaxis protein CheA [Paracrocinitomix mangrovi]UKN01604.1 chemotaxis protein CheA [Paracrocinitomix mangrovi]